LRAATRKLHHRLFVFSFKQTTTQPASAVVVFVVVVVVVREARLLFIYQVTTNRRNLVVFKTRCSLTKKGGEHKC